MAQADYLVEDTSRGQDLVVTGAWHEEMRRALSLDGVDGLVLNYARGFQGRNLEFVKNLPIRRLKVTARTLDDLDPIYSLGPHLLELGLVVSSRARLDLGQLPSLTGLNADWPVISASIGDAVAVADLYISSYDGVDFVPLRDLRSLQSLMMKDRPRLESLNGLGAFPELTHLSIVLAVRLEDFSALRTETNESLLVNLSLQACSGLNNLDDLTSLTNLRRLNVAACGDIASLSPLAKLQELRELIMYESTRVLDDDLSPLLHLPHLVRLAAKSRRSYRPSLKEVVSHLEARRALVFGDRESCGS